MPDVALLALVTVAIAIGFFLGRRRGSRSAAELFQLPFNRKHYFTGLNYLLNEEPDKAVDAFVESLEVNAETLETHLALGKMMRKQGQVDRAIRIHQNLLARHTLNEQHQHQAHLELARDFMVAGLLDRAELLLKEVISESVELRGEAQRFLLDIFQDEREWQDAIQVAQALTQSKYMKANPLQRRELLTTISHFYCELVEEAKAGSQVADVRGYLDRALSFDKHSVRALLLLGAFECEQQRPKQAIKTLNRIAQQSPDYYIESLPELFRAYLLQDPVRGFDAFVDQVNQHVQQRPCTACLLFLIDRLLERAADEPVRQEQAQTLLVEFLDAHPSIDGVHRALSMQAAGLEGKLAHNIQSLDVLLTELLKKRTLYRCGQCGFAGRQLHWHCPGCRGWDKMQRIKRNDTD